MFWERRLKKMILQRRGAEEIERRREKERNVVFYIARTTKGKITWGGEHQYQK